MPPPSAPLVDLALLSEVLEYGGREAGLAELFVSGTARRLDQLESAIAARDTGAIGLIAHSMTGSCATFGAQALAGAATPLVRGDEAERLTLAAARLPELRALYTRTAAVVAAAADGHI